MDSRVDALGSLRGKVGWVVWLVYGTGGVAFANVKETISQSASVTFCSGVFSLGVCSNGPTPVLTPGVLPTSRLITGTTSSVSTGDTTMVGWAAGAGIDWKYAMGGGSALVFGVEYLHYGFPSQTIELANNAGLALQFSARQDVDVIKGRISYFFPIH